MKYFHTTCEDNKRKFYNAANSIILNNHLSEECRVYLIRFQCLPILTHMMQMNGIAMRKV